MPRYMQQMGFTNAGFRSCTAPADTPFQHRDVCRGQAKRQEDDLRLKRNIEERRREKEEEARAREKIRVKLGTATCFLHNAPYSLFNK